MFTLSFAGSDSVYGFPSDGTLELEVAFSLLAVVLNEVATEIMLVELNDDMTAADKVEVSNSLSFRVLAWHLKSAKSDVYGLIVYFVTVLPSAFFVSLFSFHCSILKFSK